jgi:hypothetical protein
MAPDGFGNLDCSPCVRQRMEILVCHRQWAVVQLARLQAERRGIKVRVAMKPALVVGMALASRPDAIVLGPDLQNPTTEELKGQLALEPTLRGVPVIVAKGAASALLQGLDRFRA